MITFSTLVGIYPDWHSRLYRLLSKISWTGAGGRAFIAGFVKGKIDQREKERKSMEKSARGKDEAEDFLEKLMNARDQDPDKVTDYHIFVMGQSNVTAGSDTTAISLSSIMWHLMTNPEAMSKLREEIDDFTAQGRCSTAVTFQETQEMPYFQAVIKEALRMHAATGLPLWRVVPAGGAEISGRFFPEGTVVGLNTWVAHYNEETFPRADKFRPERWLEAEAEPEKLKQMNLMYMPVSPWFKTQNQRSNSTSTPSFDSGIYRLTSVVP